MVKDLFSSHDIALLVVAITPYIQMLIRFKKIRSSLLKHSAEFALAINSQRAVFIRAQRWSLKTCDPDPIVLWKAG
jgi:hypothetical protein